MTTFSRNGRCTTSTYHLAVNKASQMLDLYVPPASTSDGKELPAGTS
jgi:hypothetical protein